MSTKRKCMCSFLETGLNLCPGTSDFHGTSSCVTARLLSYCFQGDIPARRNIVFILCNQIRDPAWRTDPQKAVSWGKSMQQSYRDSMGMQKLGFLFCCPKWGYMKLQSQELRAVGVININRVYHLPVNHVCKSLWLVCCILSLVWLKTIYSIKESCCYQKADLDFRSQ